MPSVLTKPRLDGWVDFDPRFQIHAPATKVRDTGASKGPALRSRGRGPDDRGVTAGGTLAIDPAITLRMAPPARRPAGAGVSRQPLLFTRSTTIEHHPTCGCKPFIARNCPIALLALARVRPAAGFGRGHSLP